MRELREVAEALRLDLPQVRARTLGVPAQLLESFPAEELDRYYSRRAADCGAVAHRTAEGRAAAKPWAWRPSWTMADSLDWKTVVQCEVCSTVAKVRQGRRDIVRSMLAGFEPASW